MSSNGLQKGIFEPMFGDVVDEVERELRAQEQADEEYDSEPNMHPRLRAAEILDEHERQRERQERRQKMLLIERLLDEWPETRALLATQFGATTLSQSVWDAVQPSIQALEQRAINLLAAVGERMYARRMAKREVAQRLGGRQTVYATRTSSGAEPCISEPWTPEGAAVQEALHDAHKRFIKPVFDRLLGRVWKTWKHKDGSEVSVSECKD